MISAFSPFDIFLVLKEPFQWVLQELTQVFSQVGILSAIGAFGLAVIVLTIGIRAALFPIFGWQLRTSRRIQAEQRLIAPQLQELRKKYKKEPQKLSAEMNKLYKEHGISPFSSLTGCIPALLQMPVLLGLYQAIRAVTGALNASDKAFLWIPDVTQSAQAAIAAGGNSVGSVLGHAPLLILPLLSAAFTFAQSRMMMPPTRSDMSDQERSMQSVSKQMSYIFPLMIGVFSFLFPQGLAIYWVTGTMFMVAQQHHLLGWGGLRVPTWMPGAGRVTALTLSSTPATASQVSANSSKNGQKGKNGKSGAATGAASTRPASSSGRPGGEEERETARTPSNAAARSMTRTGTRPNNRPNRRRRRR